MSVSADCANGQDIRASYELSYTSSSGTSITTCVVDGIDCSNGVCRHELQNNVTDIRCQPPVAQFNSESVTVTVTAGNIVGRSNPAVSRTISELITAFATIHNSSFKHEVPVRILLKASKVTHSTASKVLPIQLLLCDSSEESAHLVWSRVIAHSHALCITFHR